MSSFFYLDCQILMKFDRFIGKFTDFRFSQIFMFLLRSNFNEFYQKNSNFSKTGKIASPANFFNTAGAARIFSCELPRQACRRGESPEPKSQNTRRHAQDRAEAGHNPRENVGADSKILQSKAHAARTRHD
jgi:hypothetical protein